MSSSEADIDTVINEEYKIWKKNTPFLYDTVMTHSLEWPSLTVQWFGEKQSLPDTPYTKQKILLGTHTSGAETNYLMVAEVRLPNWNEATLKEVRKGSMEPRKYDEDHPEFGGFGGSAAKIEITQQIVHDGEVDRARIMPQNPFVVATRTVDGPVHVFDISKHESKPSGNVSKPQLKLLGLTKEGYGLSWSPKVVGRVAACSDAGEVCTWDIDVQEATKVGATQTMQALRTFQAHDGVVGDVQWHPHHEHMFGTVGGDSFLRLWDMRTESGGIGSARQSVKAHTSDVNSIAFNPFQEFVLATGGSDKNIHLWDYRNMARSLHTISGHNDEVLSLEWNPANAAILASGSVDRRVMVWDMAAIGKQISLEDAEDGAPELLFIHAGHTSKVNDLSWNPCEDWMLASVAEDNIIQVWQMAENIYCEDDAEEPADSILE